MKTFSDLFKVKHGYAFKSKFFADEGAHVVLTPGNFHEKGGFKEQEDKRKFYTGDIPQDFILNTGDVIIAMTEQAPGLLGSSAWIPRDGYYLHNQRLGKIIDVNEDEIDLRFLYYLFNTAVVRSQISGSASGTKIRHTAPERIGRVRVAIPAVDEQRRIATILSSYDDLIENNRKRIKLLERAARLLYKEWFVRLRFPGWEGVKVVQSELGSIPATWKVAPLGELCTKIGSGSTPRGGEAAYKEEGVTLVRSQNVYDFAFTMDGLAYIDDEQAADLDGVTLQANDILLNITGASVGRCCMMPSRLLPGRVNQHVMIIRADAAKISPAYILCALNSPARKAQLLSLAQGKGATREALTKSSMEQFKIVLPDEGTWKAFAAKVEPMFELRETLEAQNAALTRARDLLLPRLMCGKVKV
ncbi:MAG: restriction endonuclease subunit S [Flavobacteriales bacterium]|nr:restriction endonuclease subunit S [Flavobacteriales bacterium]